MISLNFFRSGKSRLRVFLWNNVVSTRGLGPNTPVARHLRVLVVIYSFKRK